MDSQSSWTSFQGIADANGARRSPSNEPIFVLCGARSGSTLLRYALDAHPEICCPAELNIAETLAHMSRVYTLMEISSAPNAPRGERMPAAAVVACRNFADSTLGACARKQAKQRWADKSLVNASYAELIYQVYPSARYICLFRGCADFIASAHEASPWGMMGYGFEPYIRDSPANSVLAMARYWADHVDAMVNFRANHPDSAFSVRYEDLVADPQQILEQLFEFLRTLDASLPSTEAIFDDAMRSPGAQDHKITFTSCFESSSVGRGWSIPTEMIPPQLVERIDRLSEQLGYGPLDGQLEDAVVGDGNLLSGRETSIVQPADELREHIDECFSEFFRQPRNYSDLGAMKFLVPGIDECWVIDFAQQEVRQGKERCASTLIADGAAFVEILSGDRNAPSEVRRGSMRAVAPTTTSDAADVQRYLDAFLAELKVVVDSRRWLRVDTNDRQLTEV